MRDLLSPNVSPIGAVKRLFVGRPLSSQQLGETLLPKWLALPVFASDPLSSVAYATEEIVLVLAGGGAAYLSYSKWVATAIVALLVIVILSYRQTCHAYPSGGGAFAVSLDNFGPTAALIAASALLVAAIGFGLLELYPRAVSQDTNEQVGEEWARRMEIVALSFF